jgi:ribonuclease III
MSQQVAQISKERKKELLQLLTTLGFTRPKNYMLYHTALIHSSYTHENRLSLVDNYERLEYLGDAVLKLVVSEYLFENFSDYREGELTKIRAVAVSDHQLAFLARQISLGSFIIFGNSEAKSGGKDKSSNLACAFEALLGALYLDGKLDQLRALLPTLFEAVITDIASSKMKNNFKAALQELTQAELAILPVYKTVQESGPSHNRRFQVEVSVQGEVMGVGTGNSKKEAQQLAAKLALAALNALEEDDAF